MGVDSVAWLALLSELEGELGLRRLLRTRPLENGPSSYIRLETAIIVNSAMHAILGLAYFSAPAAPPG